MSTVALIGPVVFAMTWTSNRIWYVSEEDMIEETSAVNRCQGTAAEIGTAWSNVPSGPDTFTSSQSRVTFVTLVAVQFTIRTALPRVGKVVVDLRIAWDTDAESVYSFDTPVRASSSKKYSGGEKTPSKRNVTAERAARSGPNSRRSTATCCQPVAIAWGLVPTGALVALTAVTRNVTASDLFRYTQRTSRSTPDQSTEPALAKPT